MPAGMITLDGNEFPFLIAKPPDNFPMDIASNLEEVLTANGVDGKRWRILSAQLAQFDMFTLVDCANFTAAVQLARSYKTSQLHNSIGRLVLTLDGFIYTFSNVHVAGCRPVPTPGQVVGVGAGTNTAGVLCDWVIDFTEFDVSANF